MKDLLFYTEYEEFYAMAKTSAAFSDFCREAYGDDFSQDGFSDISQINRILDVIPAADDLHMLDIGCGNGKMLRYLQQKTGGTVHGFDYSRNAIETAKEKFQTNADFKMGVIGEIDYPHNLFDIVISMDTMYFAKDMCVFVSQIKDWLKPNGILFVGYQEGGIMPKTRSGETTSIAKALRTNEMKYRVIDITKETYLLQKRKRDSAIKFAYKFEQENLMKWYSSFMNKAAYLDIPLEEYETKNARYIYIATK